MFAFLTEAGFQPFVIAGLVLVGLCLIEVTSLVFGHSLSGAVDHLLGLDHADADVHAHVPHGSVVDLHAGVPTDTPVGNLFGSFYDWQRESSTPHPSPLPQGERGIFSNPRAGYCGGLPAAWSGDSEVRT